MSAETIARTIQLILAPVVMVSACAILTGGIHTHYAAVNERLRALSRERLELLRGADGMHNVTGPVHDALHIERLSEVDWQLPRLLRRHELIHHGLLAIYGAIATFVLSMFVIAFVAAIPSSQALAGTALLIFLAGTALLLVGAVLVCYEIRLSDDAVQHEVKRVVALGR